MYRIAGTVARTVEKTAEVTVQYDKEDPEQVTIESVEFQDNSVELFVDEDELERVDDNDYGYDMEPPDCEPDDLKPPDSEPPDYEPEDVEPPYYEPPDHDEP
jgi:hypothetical protein